MKINDTILTELFELANQYPSPHNGQPVEIRRKSDDTFVLYFDRERGLQATEISYLFSYVTMGVFMEHFKLSAQALGHVLSWTLQLPPVADLRGAGAVQFATCRLTINASTMDQELKSVLEQRQTSRKKYYEGVSDEVSDETIRIAADSAMQLVKMNRADTHQAIWLNQRAVFDDMFDDAVRDELNYWLRYDEAEKVSKRDGLAYDCMELNGRAMKFIVKHRGILRAPGVSGLLKRYYLRTMSDNSDAFYLLTPFSTELEAYEVGIATMKIWLAIAQAGYYLHPFGTIMSNEAAHADFLTLANIAHEDKHTNFLVFIYRAGKSEVPVQSLRLPVDQHLYRGTHV